MTCATFGTPVATFSARVRLSSELTSPVELCDRDQRFLMRWLICHKGSRRGILP
jgi:hypothetical protein